MTVAPVSLPLSAIRLDGGTQPRAVVDDTAVEQYAEAMEDGAVFPPVKVYHDGANYWLVSGFHRYRAVESLGLQEIDADVCQGTLRDAILCSVGENATHGLRRTNEDKRRAVRRLLEDEHWRRESDIWIAERCAVTNRFVAGIREIMYPPEPDPSLNCSGMRLAQRNGATYPIRPANQYSPQPYQPSGAREPGIRERDVKPRSLQIRGTLESISLAMTALPTPDQAVIADPDFDVQVAEAYARWWQAFASHLRRRADRAS